LVVRDDSSLSQHSDHDLEQSAALYSRDQRRTEKAPVDPRVRHGSQRYARCYSLPSTDY
jgi:hypothetical protein